MLRKNLPEINAEKAVQNSIIALLFITSFFAIIIKFSGAFPELIKADFFLVLLSSLFFIASVIVWAFAWAFVLRKEHKLGYGNAAFFGISSMFASFTPMQLGNDLLRAFLLKEAKSVPMHKGIGASMLVKGIKFLTLALFSVFALLLSAQFHLFGTALTSFFVMGLIAIILSAAILLLPISKMANKAMLSFLSNISLIFRPLSGLDYLFADYSYFLSRGAHLMPKIFVFCIIALFFEFLCFVFSAFAIGIYPAFDAILLLFFAIALLERVPFTPRGVGLVETAMYLFLSGSLQVDQAKIISFIAIFDFARIILPTTISLIVFLATRRKRPI